LNFKEFVLNAWIFATKDFEGVCGYAFDNFDLDGSGELKLGEVREMIADVHAAEKKSTADIEKEVVELLKTMDDGNHDKIITKSEFCAHCLEFQELLFPALQIQVNITNKIVGQAFWDPKIKEAPRYNHILYILLLAAISVLINVILF